MNRKEKNGGFWRKFLFRTPVLVIIVAALFISGFQLSKNKIDPFWLKLDTILVCNGMAEHYESDFRNAVLANSAERNLIKPASEMKDSIRNMYRRMHGNSRNALPIIEYMEKPFFPTWPFEKIKYVFDTLSQRQKILINGVTGSGKSTMVDNLAKIIAGSPERIHKLQCVEKMAVEYHKRWIGRYENDTTFVPGKLLRLMEEARENPHLKYVFILDDLDKIPPATFFGSELWVELNEPRADIYIEGYPFELTLPKNLYLISVIHHGVNSVYNLDDEEQRRISDIYYDVKPDYKEFLLYILSKNDENCLKPFEIKRIIYSFKKINEYLETNHDYGPGFQLGQWSTIRKNISKEDFETFIGKFITHVNGLKPARRFLYDDIEDFIETIDNDGRIPKSNDLYLGYLGLLETGVFSELIVALGFALISGAFTWFFIIKKRLTINNMQKELSQILQDYKSSKIEYEDTLDRILAKKNKIEDMVAEREIKHDEAVYLLLYIEDQMKAIKKLHELDDLTKSFQDSFKNFMQDDSLDDHEFEILTGFLEAAKPTMSTEVYLRLKNDIISIHEKSKAKAKKQKQ